MMRAYAYSSSIEEDDELVLCVEPGKRFRVELGCPAEPAGIFEFAPRHRAVRPDEDWCWPAIHFTPSSGRWIPGVHHVFLWECDAEGLPIDDIGRAIVGHEAITHLETNAAMFIVTPPRPVSPIAYIVPLATMHAYNFTGGGCLYGYRNPPAERLSKVTMRRPGFGIGGQSRELADCYDSASPRQAFAHWDEKAIGWLRSNGFAPDCYTDLDLDGRDILTGHRLMISAGHHEYWSQRMRDRVRDFLNSGGNVAIFSGNTCYRKISFGEDATLTRENEAWPDSNEAELTGVSYSRGGGWWNPPERAPLGYRVRAPDHWAFEGVALGPDFTFGAEDRLLGYECDGVVPGVSPPNLLVLASAHLRGGWNNGEGHTAAMVCFESGRGTVFNAATTDWARILGDPRVSGHSAVARITHNVVRKLSGNGML